MSLRLTGAKIFAILGLLILLILGLIGLYGVARDILNPPGPTGLPGAFGLMLLSIFLWPPAMVLLILSFLISIGFKSTLLRTVYIIGALIHLIWPLSILAPIIIRGVISFNILSLLLIAIGLPIPPLLLLLFLASRR
ncbi:MAG: hypothetical protein QW784_05880 [Acidilobaceae archaeon]